MKNLTKQIGTIGIAATLFLVLVNAPRTSGATQRTKERKPPISQPGSRNKAYVLGRLDGGLAAALMAAHRPVPWKGQTDGVLLMPGTSLQSLSEGQQRAVTSMHSKGFVIVITNATQEHIDTLNKLLGIPGTSDVPAGVNHLDAYASTMSRTGLRGYSMAPPVPLNESATVLRERPENIARRVRELTEWIREIQPAKNAHAASPQGTLPVQIYNNINSWQQTYSQPVTYYWATCGTPTYNCTNNYTLQINVWPVYSQSNAQYDSQNPSSPLPIDFFITQLTGNMSAAGCFGFYGNRNHPNRISAYWARQYNLAAAVQGNWPLANLNISNGWAPQAANPSVSVASGTSWSLSGTGTVGASATGPTGSVGFTAGVSFNNTSTVSYPALQVQPNIGSSQQTLNVAGWTYDSWNYVHSSIQPNNTACGGPGLSALPPIITNGTFSPQDTWVWQAFPAVRQQYSGGSLPVQIDLSLLLGWTVYQGGKSLTCKPSGGNGGSYPLEYNFQSFKVGNAPLQGLTFDVGCNTPTLYGTIPLGPTSNQNWGMGNPGSPYSIPSWVVHPPFAATSAQ